MTDGEAGQGPATEHPPTATTRSEEATKTYHQDTSGDATATTTDSTAAAVTETSTPTAAAALTETQPTPADSEKNTETGSTPTTAADPAVASNDAPQAGVDTKSAQEDKTSDTGTASEAMEVDSTARNGNGGPKEEESSTAPMSTEGAGEGSAAGAKEEVSTSAKRPREEETEATRSEGEAKKPKTETNANVVASNGPVASSNTPAKESTDGTFVAGSSTSTPQQTAKRNTNQLIWVQQKLMKKLTDHPQSWPFLRPVDPVLLGLKNYFDIIKHPMDLSTVKKNLKARNYWTVSEAIADLKQIFTNCRTYNPPTDDVVVMGDNLEKEMEKFIEAEMPKEEIVSVPKFSRSRQSVATSAPTIDSGLVSPGSTGSGGFGGPASRRSSSRPVRPTNKDVLEAELSLPKKKPPRNLTNRMKFCTTVIRELMHKKHSHVSWPFLQPVNPIELGIPDYFDVLKKHGLKAMDLGTVKRNLEAQRYEIADEFHADVELIFKNCFAYNPAGHDVNTMGKSLQVEYLKLMSKEPKDTPDTKAKGNSKPYSKGARSSKGDKSSVRGDIDAYSDSRQSRHDDEAVDDQEEDSSSSDSESESDSDDSEDESTTRVKMMQAQIDLLSRQMQMITNPNLKKKKGKKKSKKDKKSEKGKKSGKKSKSDKKKAGVKKSKPKTTPKPKAKPRKPASKPRTKVRKDVSSGSDSDSSSSDEEDERVMTWDQKRTLSEEIHQLEESQLPEVIKIVKSREKGLKDSNPEEIEIDFNQLGNGTLWELHAFLQDCKKKAAQEKAARKKSGANPKLAREDRKADLMRELENNQAQQAAVYGHDDR